MGFWNEAAQAENDYLEAKRLLREVDAAAQALDVPGASLRPRSRAWKFVGPWTGSHTTHGAVWERKRLRVISAHELVEYPDGSGEVGPCWHVSVSRQPPLARPSDAEVRLVALAFGMPAAEEDNHHPGVARHLFCPVDPTRRVDCECKVDERVVVEADGYRWTTPFDGPCRGCVYEKLTGRPCRQHRTP